MFNSRSSMTIESSPKEGLFQKVIINYGLFTTNKLHQAMKCRNSLTTLLIGKLNRELLLR